MGELTAWAKDKLEVPDDDDQVFVCAYEHDFDSPMFRICFSTPRLLKVGALTKNIYTDGTYKLIWQGYPVLIVGFSDASRKMHPIALAVTMTETQDGFRFIFDAILCFVIFFYKKPFLFLIIQFFLG